MNQENAVIQLNKPLFIFVETKNILQCLSLNFVFSM